MTKAPSIHDANPPLWAEYFLCLLVGPSRYESISGDLLEEYRRRVLPEMGAAKARLWYMKELLGYISVVQMGLALGVVSSIAIIVTNVIFPLLRIDIPDPSGTEGLVHGVFFGGTILLWGLAGSLIRLRAGTFAASIQAGAIVALVHIGIVMLTFSVINNLFLDVILKQPDKIWGLQHSSYPSMRAYVNYTALRGLYLVLPIFVGLGAMCGAAGGLIGSARRQHPRTHQ